MDPSRCDPLVRWQSLCDGSAGGEQTNITDDAANDADPDWQPKPR